MITKDMVVSMNYTLKDESGNVLDASNGQPLEYLQGHNNIIPGLEKELSGLNVGDKKQVKVTPEEGYGQYDPGLKFTIGLDQFQGQQPQPGMMVQMESEEGVMMAKIVGIEEQKVVLDANHPLAGQPLFFDVEIAGVRPASSEEIAHGHPHGPHGHHH
jgi:FKBP-type peptidyl-prolyl cis-trans isomerase SlyD